MMRALARTATAMAAGLHNTAGQAVIKQIAAMQHHVAASVVLGSSHCLAAIISIRQPACVSALLL
jgi:hypothetical protein